MLPSLDGFEIVREVRRDSRIPIVMLTARTDATDVIVGLELGADDYVTKPFDMPILVARCRAVPARRREPADPTSASATSRSTSPGSSPCATAATSR